MLRATVNCVMLGEADNCLTEINEVRSQDSLGLSSFVAKAQTSTGAAPEDVAPTESVELAKAFTCDVIKAGNAPILVRLTTFLFLVFGPRATSWNPHKTLSEQQSAKYHHELNRYLIICSDCECLYFLPQFSNNKRSVMYYSGSSATCSNAITEWKKGYDKFKWG